MCSNCSGDYEDPDLTGNELSEHYAASITRGRILCACQAWFESQETFDHHLIETCPHTDEVRWNPLREEWTCLKCGVGVDIPELTQKDQNVSVKL